MRQTGLNSGVRVLVAALLLALAAPNALAQRVTIEGTVQTEDGSAVAGAEVRLVPETSGRSTRNTKTKKDGSFRFPLVEFGTYRLRAAKEGLLMAHLKGEILLPTKQAEHEWETDVGPFQEVPEFRIEPGRTANVGFTMVPKERFAAELTIPGDRKATDKLQEANRLSGERQYAKSNELLEEVLGSGEATANVYYLLGRNAFGLGDMDQAEKWFLESLELDPAKQGVCAQLGSIAYDRGDKEPAAAWFARELENDPDAVPVAINLGLVLSELDRTDEAVAAFEKVIEMKPDEGPAYTALADLYMKQGHEDRAAEVLRRMEAFTRPDPAMWFNIGAGFSNRDQFEEAAMAYSKALEIDPEFPDAVRELGYLKVRAGDRAGARELFERYLRLRPEAPDADDVRSIVEVLKGSATGEP